MKQPHDPEKFGEAYRSLLDRVSPIADRAMQAAGESVELTPDEVDALTKIGNGLLRALDGPKKE